MNILYETIFITGKHRECHIMVDEKLRLSAESRLWISSSQNYTGMYPSREHPIQEFVVLDCELLAHRGDAEAASFPVLSS